VSKDPKQQGRSVAEQEAECRAVCDRGGWQVLDVLCDNDRSASRYATKTRPQWEEVKRRIANGDGVDVLVTWEASRGGRDLGEFAGLRDLCRANGVKLNYSGRTIDFDDSSDSFRAGLDALISEDESERTRKRVLRAMRAQADEGMPHGRPLFGYRLVYNDDRPPKLIGQEPSPDDAEIVREIARRFLSGESMASITADLNARKVPFTSDRPWTATRVKRILMNPGYTGKRVHQGEVVGDAKWEPIIDQQMFDAIAGRFERPGVRGGEDVLHLLSGIARCGKCGGPMYVRRGTYECAPSGGHLARNERHLDAYVTAVILERLATIDLDDLGAEHPEATEQRRLAAELRGRVADAADKFAGGEISSAVLARVEANLTPKIRAAEKRARAAAVPPNLGELAGAGVDQRWDALSVEQQREIVRLLLDVTVLPDIRPRGSRGFDPDAVRLEWRT
jgi:site-specific DNA recombinase